jgi:hypothetical protein
LIELAAWLSFVVAALVQGADPLVADTVTCSTWQQIITCSSPGGYMSHQTTWNGNTIGEDNRGDRWTRSEWHGREIITATPRHER